MGFDNLEGQSSVNRPNLISSNVELCVRNVVRIKGMAKIELVKNKPNVHVLAATSMIILLLMAVGDLLLHSRLEKTKVEVEQLERDTNRVMREVSLK